MSNQIKKVYPAPTATYEQVAQSSQLFWEKLKDFHNSFKTKFSIPTVGGKALDLHRLFIEVTTRGGFEKVVGDRKWKEVVVVFNFPTTITSGSFVLRKYYTSLLYHFEQLYYFRKQFPPHDPACKNDFDDEVFRKKRLPAEGVDLQAGYAVNGTIDGKFDNGYLITVNTGSEELKGVLYHVPQKKSRKSRKSGFNIFFAEQCERLKPIYGDQEKAMSKEIGLLWNDLTGAEKQVYKEKGVRDNERLENETL